MLRVRRAVRGVLRVVRVVRVRAARQVPQVVLPERPERLARPGLLEPLGLRALQPLAVARLRSMSGVGEWTAQYIAMRELREPDAFPATDIGLLRAMADAGGRRPTPAQLLARAENWRPWRAYATLHLWTAEAHSRNSAPKLPPDRSRRAA